MAIDVVNEEAIPIKRAPAFIPGRPNVSTVYRWTLRARNPLETFRVGGRTFTTREAILRFISACSGAPPPPAGKGQQRRIAAAEAELEAAGV